MATKEERQAAINRLVRGRRMGTQGELTKALRAKGIAVDQSTLSRDLTELGIRKSAGRYVVPSGNGEQTRNRVEYSSVVRRFTTCGPHLIVISTAVGQAQPVAVAIDEEYDGAIAGTLAGDDTIFVATGSARAQTVALRRLKKWFGDKYER